MLNKCGPLHPNWKPEKHTPTILAMIECVKFLSNFQDVSICSRCGKSKQQTLKIINVHHIDENHENILISNLEPLCVPCHGSFHFKRRKRPFVKVCKIFTFAGAHKLPNYNGKCANLHGHEWKIEVCVKKRVDPDTGMVMDFSDLKNIVNKCVIDKLDHGYLNDYIKNPTAENLLVWMWEQLMFEGLLKGIDSIKIWETETSYAELTVDGMLSVLKENIENYLRKVK